MVVVICLVCSCMLMVFVCGFVIVSMSVEVLLKFFLNWIEVLLGSLFMFDSLS